MMHGEPGVWVSKSILDLKVRKRSESTLCPPLLEQGRSRGHPFETAKAGSCTTSILDCPLLEPPPPFQLCSFWGTRRTQAIECRSRQGIAHTCSDRACAEAVRSALLLQGMVTSGSDGWTNLAIRRGPQLKALGWWEESASPCQTHCRCQQGAELVIQETTLTLRIYGPPIL